MEERVARGLTFTMIVEDGLLHLGELDTYSYATIIARYNDVTTFEIEMPADTDAARLLLGANRPRILLRDDRTGQTFRSGPITRYERTSSLDGPLLHLYG